MDSNFAPTLNEVIEKLEWLRKQHGGNVAVPFATNIRYVFEDNRLEILLEDELSKRDEE